ncbi:MAG: tetratricopeptide repeat protein [Candidatus Kryptonium sp.]|nr:tetratricopeptide repeat protein [Candidatus Kryptonium sp.]
MKKFSFAIILFISFISSLISQDLERAVKRLTQPEVMVVIDEIVDGNFTGTRTIASNIENELLKEGFKIIDHQIFSNIRASELQQVQGNPEKAREYENRFGAEIIILGYATAEYGGESEFYDVKQHKYTGQVDIKVIYTDTGELIASITASDRKFAQDKRGAVNSLFRSLASKVSKNVVAKIKERLKEEEQVKKIEIAIYGISQDKALQIESELQKSVPSIKALKYKFFDTNVLVFDALISGESQFRKELADYGKLKLVKLTPKRITLSPPEKETEAKTAIGEAFLDITDFSILPIFPSQYNFYAYNPIGQITIENSSRSEIRNVKVSVLIPDFMKIPSEVVVQSVKPNSKQQISVPVTLDISALLKLSENLTSQAQAKISYTVAGKVQERSLSKPVIIYNRNAISWRIPESVSSFVTPSDEVVKEFARVVLSSVNLQNPDLPRNIFNAMVIYNAVRTYGIKYVTDPWKVAGNEILDNVYFPRELLYYKTGDCDDHAILLASLLESIGISSAFILTSDHIFLMFDTGIPQKNAYLVSFNPYDYIIYNGSVWIPIETTLINEPFATAWKTGAEQYYKLGGSNKVTSDPKAGITKSGNVYIIDIHKGWKNFPPVNVEGLSKPQAKPNISAVASNTQNDIAKFTEIYKQTLNDVVRSLANKGDEISMNKLARIFVLFDKYDEAEKFIAKFSNAVTYNSLGNIYFLKNEAQKAFEFYKKSTELDPNDGGVYLNIGLLLYLNDDTETAKQFFELAISKFDSPQKAYEILGIEDILRELGEVAAEKKDASKKQVSKQELKKLIEEASKTATQQTKKGKEYKREEIFEKGQNVFVFGGRRGADPTQLQTVKALLYWKF